MEKILKRNLYYSNVNKVPEFKKQVVELSEFEKQKYVLVEEDQSINSARQVAQSDLHATEQAKQKLKQEETEKSGQCEAQFYQMMHDIRQLDLEKDRTDKYIRDEGGRLDDEANEVSKKMGHENMESLRLEKDIRSMKEHLQTRKNVLDSKLEWLKRENQDKNRKVHLVVI